MSRIAFAECLERGTQGEKTLDKHFNQYYHIRPATQEEQRRGIDRTFTHKGKHYKLSVEYKTDDRASETGNAALETAKMLKPRRQGWVFTCTADYLIYYIPGLKKLLVIQPEIMRFNIGAWLAAYPLRFVKSRGNYQIYQTEVLLVPLTELEKIAVRVVKL